MRARALDTMGIQKEISGDKLQNNNNIKRNQRKN